MASKLTNAIVVDMSTTRVAAIKKYLTNTKTEIPVAGEVLKPAAVAAVFQNSVDTRGAVTTKRAELKAAQKSRDDAEVARVAADDALKGYVTNRFGADSTEAHEFGYGPKKVAVIPVDTKQQAVVRNKATREARHTMGPKAKLKVKGTTVVLTASAAPTDAGTAAATTTPVVVAATSGNASPTATTNGAGH